MPATYEGTPCRRFGHTLRYVSGRGCVECFKAAKKVQSLKAKDEYREWKKANPLIKPSYSHDPIERFLYYVRINFENGCHEWIGNRDYYGYGRFWLKDKYVFAYRFAYELEKGAIPAGLEIDHICCNPSCVNLEHLDVVTRSENQKRVYARRDPKRCCINGHELTPENVYVRQNGWRECRICKRLNIARSYYKRKANKK